MEHQSSGATLSENGILYLSSGFQGPYTLQVIAFTSTSSNSYNLCLTDGKLYIGGKFISQEQLKIAIYSIVKIQAKFVSKWAPIQIVKLQVISNKINYLIGKAPATLHDYFLQEKDALPINHEKVEQKKQIEAKSIVMSQGCPRKKTKLQIEKSQKQIISSSSSEQACIMETQTQKIPINVPSPAIFSIQNTQTQSFKLKSDSQANQSSQLQQISPPLSSKPQNRQQIQTVLKHPIPQKSVPPSTNAKQTVYPSHLHHEPQKHKVTKSSKIYMAEDNEILVTKQLHKSGQTHNVYIADLYERMLRWKILCRVLYCRSFFSAKGKKCTILQFIDQKGEQIKAVYYFSKNRDKEMDGVMQGVAENRVYSIQGGQIKNSSNGQPQSLQITLDHTCKIQQYNDIFIYPFCEKHLTKLSKIKETESTVNIIGELRSYDKIAANEHTYKSKPKIKGLLYDPIEKIQIQFSKIFLDGEKQPIINEIYVMNGFIGMQVDNSVRLVGVNNCFMVKVTQEDMLYSKAPNYPQSKYLQALCKAMATKFNPHTIQNLSQTPYSKRTISQLLQMSTQTQNALYSQMLVSIGDIKLKKQYMACPICKRSTIQQQQAYILYQCLKCKKIVDPIPTVIVRIMLADATGSLQIDVFGTKVEVFIGIQIQEFVGLSQQEKQCTLQIAKFSQFVVKIKTEKKAVKQLIHTLQQVQKQELVLTMKQIRRRTVEQKLKLQEKWSTDI